jgi:hypothetical protein
MQQNDARPPNFEAYFAWDSQVNGNYGTNSLTATANGSAAIAGGYMSIISTGVSYVSIGGTGYAPGNQGTFAFEYVPNYSGSPAHEQYIYSMGFATNGNDSLISLTHETSRAIDFSCFNSSGSAIFSASFAGWSPTAGTAYTFVVQIDTTNGASKLFINGTQFGTTQTGTGTRGLTGYIYFGTDRTNSVANPNFSMGRLAFYSGVVGPSGLTPLNDYIYTADVISLPAFTGPVSSWTSFSTTDANSPGYVMNGLYWNGATWATSNLTVSESNTAAIVAANIATLPAALSLVVEVLTTSSNTVQQSVSLMTVGWDYMAYPQTNPSIKPYMRTTVNGLLAIEATYGATGSDAVQYQMEVNGQAMWWNGTAWANASGYAQTNTYAALIANITTLPVSLGVYFRPIAFLSSASGTTTPNISELDFNYDYYAPAQSEPPTCFVYLFAGNLSAMDDPNAVLTVTNPQAFAVGARVIEKGSKNFSIVDGQIEAELVQSVAAGVAMQFSLAYTDPNGNKQVTKFVPAEIPEQSDIALLTLTTIAT